MTPIERHRLWQKILYVQLRMQLAPAPGRENLGHLYIAKFDDVMKVVLAEEEGPPSGMKAVQFSPKYCPEAEGAPHADWDTSHDLSLLVDGKRYRIGQFKHAAYASEVGRLIETHGLNSLVRSR